LRGAAGAVAASVDVGWSAIGLQWSAFMGVSENACLGAVGDCDALQAILEALFAATLEGKKTG
jgi:hypothetical protein